ncbi:hypothetical protein PIB30_114909, partial [Stylosanthes scabra]|nr:hypothetical protein [Stylosanthes scabra]
KFSRFYDIVMLHTMEDTLVEIGQQQKCSNLVFIGQLSSKMLMTLSRDVMNVKEQGTFKGSKKCFRITSLK